MYILRCVALPSALIFLKAVTLSIDAAEKLFSGGTLGESLMDFCHNFHLGCFTCATGRQVEQKDQETCQRSLQQMGPAK